MAYKEDINDEVLEKELEKAIKNNEAKRDHCGTPLPSSREIGIQRDKVKVKKD